MAQDQAAGRARDLSNEIPKGLAPARETMLAFLKEVEHTFGADPRTTVLGGFSQGAMLTCDAMLHTDRPYAGLVQLSGTLLALQEASRLRDTLSQSGLAVEWHRFRGGHEIPEPVLQRLGIFLTKVLTKP
jgi:phospholipase/carboxylesterase